MKICCISDTHNYHKQIVIPEGCDMIIHAGDFSNRGEVDECIDFIRWYVSLNIRHKILISGNHEVGISTKGDLLKNMCGEAGIIYLQESEVIIEGLKIYGTPYSNRFGNWAYMRSEEQLAEGYSDIPNDCNILISHGPPHKILDKCPNGNVGSVSLKKHLPKLTNLKLLVTGHIHESRGCKEVKGVTVVNASVCGIPYRNVSINPIIVDLK